MVGRGRGLLMLGMLLALAAAGSAIALSTFVDPAGDSGGAPDVTAVSVDSDAAGTLTFTVTTNQATLAADGVLYLGLDTDAKRSTGAGGIEYLVGLKSTGYQFAMWDGSRFAPVPNSTVQVSYDNGVARFVINRSDLGGTNALNFAITSFQISGTGNVVADDLAPDTGTYSDRLDGSPPPPPTVIEGKPAATTPGIHAGREFAITASVVTDAASVRVTCAAHIGTRTVRTTGRYSGGTASCVGAVPAGTAGRRLAGTVTATIIGGGKTMPFSFVIRR